MGESRTKISLKVKKMSSSIAFYRSIGFVIPQDVNKDTSLHIVSEESTFDLVLVPENKIIAESYEYYELIQIGYPDTEAVDNAFHNAVSNGCKVITKPWNTFWGTRAAKILDPDGYNILLFTNIA